MVTVLVVCTANICRSPTAARSLELGLAETGLAGPAAAEAANDPAGAAPAGGLVRVESAGVAAADDSPMCEVADTLSAARLGGGGPHRSRLLTKEIATSADLILTADRSHRTAVGRLAPSARARVFTLRQAARLADWVTADSGVLAVAAERARGIEPELAENDPREQVPTLPADQEQRIAWLISEMDAARGLAPVTPSAIEPEDWNPEDIVDPHATNWEHHAAAVDVSVASAAKLVEAFRRVTAMS